MTLNALDPATLNYYKGRLEPVPLEETTAQVLFIERILRLVLGQHILDLGCGAGRHALELAARGHRVTGLDLEPTLISLARASAQQRGLAIDFVAGDIRALDYSHTFDAATSIWSFFGRLSSQNERQALLAAVHRSLRPGGCFLIDVMNRDFMAMQDIVPFTSPTQRWKVWGSRYILESWRFDIRTSYLHIRMLLCEGPTVEVVEYSTRLYSCHEMHLLLEDAGFAIVDIFGNYDSSPFLATSRRLIIHARAL